MNKRLYNILFYLYIAFSVIMAIFLILYYTGMHSRAKTTTQAENTPQVVQVYTEDIKEPVQTKIEVREYIGEFTIYAYCPCKKCCGKDNSITASGTIAIEGRTVAANLPVGTKIYIEGIGERVVEDRGEGIKGNAVDLFVSDHQRALKFGVKKLKVYEIKE